MSGSPVFEQLTLEALEEHRQVHFYLDQLIRTLAEIEASAQADGGAPDTDAMARLSAELGSLIDRLTEHFGTEENGGLYHGVVDLLPNLAGEVHRLGQQHARLLDRLEMARLHAQRSGAVELPALRADLEDFLEVLRVHERTEDELLRQAIEVESRS